MSDIEPEQETPREDQSLDSNSGARLTTEPTATQSPEPIPDSGSETPSESVKKRIPLLAFVLFVIAVDQLTKWLVLKNMYRHQSIDLVGDWLKFTFTENPGMAFGIEYGYPGTISIVSIAATAMILIYTVKVRSIYRPYSVSLAFVLGGALGNIIDRVFYGMILYDEPIFLGKVVDFIHVNMWRGTVSESVPYFGGKFVALFPIWNVADMAIVMGVVGILYFQKKFHDLADALHEAESTDSDEPEAPATTSPSQPE